MSQITRILKPLRYYVSSRVSRESLLECVVSIVEEVKIRAAEGLRKRLTKSPLKLAELSEPVDYPFSCVKASHPPFTGVRKELGEQST